MQLYAWNEQRRLVPAGRAHRQQAYTCMECGGALYLRGGRHRRLHFFHVLPPAECRLGGKSLAHLHLQCLLQELIPTVTLERRFPEIARIADVVWEEEKVIFEIQCSPIKGSEILERNRDYGELGYTVVWLLHTRQFGRWRLSAAEWVLRNNPFYFTYLDSRGQGGFFDQYDVVQRGKRGQIVRPFPVDLAQIRRWKYCPPDVPQEIRHRITRRRVGFCGDIVDVCLHGPKSSRLDALLAIEERRERLDIRARRSQVSRVPRLLLGRLLEAACT
jgi:competence protein CoiA